MSLDANECTSFASKTNDSNLSAKSLIAAGLSVACFVLAAFTAREKHSFLKMIPTLEVGLAQRTELVNDAAVRTVRRNNNVDQQVQYIKFRSTRTSTVPLSLRSEDGGMHALAVGMTVLLGAMMSYLYRSTSTRKPHLGWAMFSTAASGSGDWPDPASLAEVESELQKGSQSASTISNSPAPGTPAQEPEPEPVAESAAPTSSINPQVAALKSSLYRQCATSSRGFGATSKDREDVQKLVDGLVATGAGFPEPTRGIMRAANYPGTVELDGPIVGTWQLLYASGSDVLVLEGNPLVQVQSIFQIIRSNGIITNIIDFGPRPTSLLPSPFGDSTFRQMVKTRGAARSATRIGLSFESVSAKLISIFGQDLSSLPPLSIDLPKAPSLFDIGADSSTADGPGYFDIQYLDGDLLIVKQSQPGGMFILTRRSDLDGKL